MPDTALMDSLRANTLPLDIAPIFRGGGITEFRYWVMRRLKYPETMLEQRVQGRVIIHFVVDEQGKVGPWDVAFSPHADLSAAVINIIAKSPLWTPGYRDGKPVKVLFEFTVDFKTTSRPQIAPLPWGNTNSPNGNGNRRHY